ncbi:MAG: hypothetical protein MZV63_06025 [Marinilabiliales bacterium]|nr:hypothetical protein [Marinilabiliales bacterium]
MADLDHVARGRAPWSGRAGRRPAGRWRSPRPRRRSAPCSGCIRACVRDTPGSSTRIVALVPAPDDVRHVGQDVDRVRLALDDHRDLRRLDRARPAPPASRAARRPPAPPPAACSRRCRPRPRRQRHLAAHPAAR